LWISAGNHRRCLPRDAGSVILGAILTPFLGRDFPQWMQTSSIWYYSAWHRLEATSLLRGGPHDSSDYPSTEITILDNISLPNSGINLFETSDHQFRWRICYAHS
jgi:hypothetical protein